MKYKIYVVLEHLPEDSEAKLDLIIRDAIRNAGLSNTIKEITVTRGRK